MNSFEKIKAIVNFIQAVNPHATAFRGLPKTKILKAFQEINFFPPPEIVKLYQWHNGINELHGFLRFVSLDCAIDWYRYFLERKIEYSEWKWDRNYFPLLDMNGDVQLCLDFETLAVITVDIECNIVEKIASHYICYLDALLYVFNNRAFEYNNEFGFINFDKEIWKYARNLYQIKDPWLQGN